MRYFSARGQKVSTTLSVVVASTIEVSVVVMLAMQCQKGEISQARYREMHLVQADSRALYVIKHMVLVLPYVT